ADAQLTRLQRAVQRAGRGQPRRAKCLPQSVALAWLLARRGIGSELRLGVRGNDGTFEAHAWLELAGGVLDPAAGGWTQFQPLARGIAALRTGRRPGPAGRENQPR